MPAPDAAVEAEAEEEMDELVEAEKRAAEEEGGKVNVVGDDGLEEELADPVETGMGGGGDDFFAGEDSLGSDEPAGEPAPGPEQAGGEVAEPGGFEEMAESQHSFEEPIVEGFARLAVVGLDDDEQDELEDEFVDVFEAFQLGHYGDRVLHEYVLVGDDDVNPIYGLAGSMLLCTVLTIYMRPDGDEIVTDAKARLQELTGDN